MREKHKKNQKVPGLAFSFLSSRHRTKRIEKMNKVSNDIKWFCNQLQQSEQILANALEKAEEFSEQDKRIIGKIRKEVEMADLTLLMLLSPKAPRWAMSHETMSHETMDHELVMESIFYLKHAR